MAKLTKKITNFKQGMTPDLYSDGLVRVEHFNTTTPQLRPRNSIVAGGTGGDFTLSQISKFVRGYKDTTYVIYALGSDSLYAAIGYWDASTKIWNGMQSFNAAGTAADFLFFYNAKLYGLWKGTNMWEMTTSSATYTLNGTFKALNYTNYADPIIHSKDGLAYIPTDNILSSFNGTDLTTVLPLPTNFIITSIAEHGDYIMIVGYDSKTLNTTAFLWDRDSSLATLTEKYDLGVEKPVHNATLGGKHFIVSVRQNSDLSAMSDTYNLVIRMINGSNVEIINEFPYTFIQAEGKYVDNKNLYFNCWFQPIGQSTKEWGTFQLDNMGRLVIALNLGSDSSATGYYGLIRDGDGFWIGGKANGQWAMNTAYTTTSIVETTKYRADKLDKNLDLSGVIVTFEALPSGASVVLKTRADSETDWTTLDTFDTDNSVKGSVTGEGVTTAKERQFRIESTGGAVITGFQADFEEVNDEVYG